MSGQASLLGRTSDPGQGYSTTPVFAFHLWVRVVSYLTFSILLKCLALCGRISTWAHERLSQYFALSPCPVYGPRESAIVIIGGDHDVGRHLALNFSELGCTVFALCSDRQASPHTEPFQNASNVSSLIQEWHKRIKRSGRSPWGLVAPIVLDMNSGAQRAHAVETVDAYCVTHNLHLVAVIVLPTNAPASPKPLASGPTGVSAWAEIVRRCLVDPISAVHGYSSLLAAASGRVVLLLASGDQVGRDSAQLAALESAARFLRREIGPLGIRVSTVSTGPFAPTSKLSVPTVNDASAAETFASSGSEGAHNRSVGSTIREVLRHFFVRYEDLWCTLHDIVRSRYPKERYVIGLHAALEDVHQALPAALRLCLCVHSDHR
ncbi:hypothetical protein BV20DRAFT_963243 [Pilatotrama ljubarskyi]|nr:hypothetical protein BV20DRAFT_963243 [Pilatotrama ljubarskyi]